MMNKLFFILILTAFLSANQFISNSYADGSINAFYRGEVEGNLKDVTETIKKALEKAKFEIKGEYHPAKKQSLYVIAFTNKKLVNLTFKRGGRRALASILKIGLRDIGENKIEVTLLNPAYVLYSYLQKDFKKNDEALLNEIHMSTILALAESANIGMLPSDAGSLRVTELKNFRFMSKMPGFNDPVLIKQFRSFDEGVRTVQRNLQAHKSGTVKVFEIIDNGEKIAFFGVGLHDSRYGEPKFLRVVGEENIAALPYELILVGNKLTMLNGRYRFPLYWSNLTMRDFQKIGRSYRDIQTTMENLAK